MWYNVYKETCYAESPDGINWQKPDLGLMGQTNKINLFDFQSPSFILDKTEPDPAKRYKAVGAKDGFGKEVINRLKLIQVFRILPQKLCILCGIFHR
jgi:hypothetical protein